MTTKFLLIILKIPFSMWENPIKNIFAYFWDFNTSKIPKVPNRPRPFCVLFRSKIRGRIIYEQIDLFMSEFLVPPNSLLNKFMVYEQNSFRTHKLKKILYFIFLTYKSNKTIFVVFLSMFTYFIFSYYSSFIWFLCKSVLQFF